MMNSTIKRVGVGVTLCLSLFGFVGCSSNNGGSTTCGDYLKMSSSKQTDAVTKMLQDHGSSTSNGNITLNKASVWAYCQTVGSNSSTIDGVYGG